MPVKTLSQLSELLRTEPNVNVCVAATGCSEQDITLQRMSLHNDIAARFRKTVESVVEHDVRREPIFKCYEIGFRPEEHEMCYVALDGLPSIVQDTISSVSDIENAELFKEDDDIINKLKFYSIVVGEGENTAVFFRTFSPKNELSKSRFYALMFWDGAYNEVKEKVFLFDDSIDCFYYGGLLYIKSVSKFHSIFRFFEALRANAEQVADTIGKRIPIQNFDEFKLACTGQQQMIAKMSSIAAKPYLSTVTIDDIKRTIKEFSLDVQLVDDNGTEKIVFERTAQKRWTILKLLDDDYLGSVMSNAKYEVNSKSSI